MTAINVPGSIKNFFLRMNTIYMIISHFKNKDLECKIQDKVIHIVAYGKALIAFADYEGKESITIRVEVTNKSGIIF